MVSTKLFTKMRRESSVQDYRRKLFTYKAPYDLEGTEDLFLEAVKENCAFHYENCKAYSKILDFHGFSPKDLKGIEENHIVEFFGAVGHLFKTKQLLCSSCQTIYIDTMALEDLYGFCEQLLPFMEKALVQHPINEIGLAAEVTLKVYHAELEALFSDIKVLRETGIA